jgi:hypothetical protein
MPDDRQIGNESADEPLPPVVARAVRALKADVSVRREWRDRVLADIGGGARTRRPTHGAIALSWPRALAAAVALFVAGGVVSALVVRHGSEVGPVAGVPGAPPTSVAAAPRAGATRFVFVAPNARHVALVGDFNMWNPANSPMQRIAGTDAWAIDIDLPAGRHVYAFVVDGDVTADPAAPRTAGEDFGRPNSVVLVSPHT